MKKLIPLLLALLCSPTFAALSVTQGAGVDGNPPGTCAISASVGSGNAIVVMTQGSTPGSLTITDNVNTGSYSLITTQFSNMGIFWLKTNASGTPTITVSGTSGFTYVWCFAITGFAGTPTIDSGILATNTGTGSGAGNPAINATSNFNNEVMLAHTGKTYTENITVTGWTNGTTGTIHLYRGFYAIEATAGTANNFSGSITSSQTWDIILTGIYDSTATGPPKSQFFFGGN